MISTSQCALLNHQLQINFVSFNRLFTKNTIILTPVSSLLPQSFSSDVTIEKITTWPQSIAMVIRIHLHNGFGLWWNQNCMNSAWADSNQLRSVANIRCLLWYKYTCKKFMHECYCYVLQWRHHRIHQESSFQFISPDYCSLTPQR